ncbi:MAG: TonB-dependent siderophore receptor [Acetobacter sp.]
MKRSTLFYTVFFSFVLSDAALAADQETQTDKPRHSEMVKPAQNSTSKAKAAAVEKELVEVRGHGKSAVMASSATKSNTPLVETAQSVTVISRDEMDARGVLSLNQAVRYAAGITADTRGGDGTRYDLFDLRGFSIPTFLDGLKVQGSPAGFAVAQTDTFRLDRVELLKGPASALYGQSSPGGLTALSSKLPTDQKFYGAVGTTGGMFDLYRVDADVGGFATDDGLVRYRLYGTVNGQHTQLAKTGSRRFSISPAFTFGGDGPTTLTLLGNYQYDPENGAYGGVPLVGSYKPGAFGYLPRNFYDGDAGFEKFNRKQGGITYILNHRFNDDWSFSTRGRYDDIKTTYRSVVSTGAYDDLYGPNSTMLSRYSYGAAEHNHNLAFDSQFKGHVRTGAVKHTLMVGFDYMQQKSVDDEIMGSAPDLDVLHPNYNMLIPNDMAPQENYLTNSQQIGAYVQDEIRWRRFVVTGSLRHDWYNTRRVHTIEGTNEEQSDSKFTWRASGLYHFDFGLAPYISYSTSFEPQAGNVDNGNGTTRQASPSMGKQLEGGLKYQLPGAPVLLSVAGYHIEQSNNLVLIPGTDKYTQSGLVHSDGFEFEAHAEPFHNLMLTAAVSVQKNKDDSTGKPLTQTSRGNASLFAFYTMPSGRLKGFGFGGGMRYTAKTYGGELQEGSVWLPQYALFDASIAYDLSKLSSSLKGWKVSANVRNLFDKAYVANCYADGDSGGSCYYGERRNAQASVGYSW